MATSLALAVDGGEVKDLATAAAIEEHLALKAHEHAGRGQGPAGQARRP